MCDARMHHGQTGWKRKTIKVCKNTKYEIRGKILKRKKKITIFAK